MARLQLTDLLSQFLEGIISLFVTHSLTRHFLSLLPSVLALLAAGFFAAGFFAAAARGLAAAFLAGAFLAVLGASSSSSLAAGATFSFFGRGPIEGWALSARISVMRRTVSSS